MPSQRTKTMPDGTRVRVTFIENERRAKARAKKRWAIEETRDGKWAVVDKAARGRVVAPLAVYADKAEAEEHLAALKAQQKRKG